MNIETKIEAVEAAELKTAVAEELKVEDPDEKAIAEIWKKYGIGLNKETYNDLKNWGNDDTGTDEKSN